MKWISPHECWGRAICLALMILLTLILLVALLWTCRLIALKGASEIIRPRVCQHPPTPLFSVDLCSSFLKGVLRRVVVWSHLGDHLQTRHAPPILMWPQLGGEAGGGCTGDSDPQVRIPCGFKPALLKWHCVCQYPENLITLKLLIQ